MTKVSDLLLVQYLVVQVSATDYPEPTVDEVAGWGDRGEMLERLIDAARAARVDVSVHETWRGTERWATLNEALSRATNAIDPRSKYGFAYDAPLGWHALLWWIIDLFPEAAEDVPFE